MAGHGENLEIQITDFNGHTIIYQTVDKLLML